MCGIVGYVGSVRDANEYILQGLEALEYRGYDSAGVSVINKNKLTTTKAVGRVEQLKKSLPQTTNPRIGIGHTRWATHGGVFQKNAHPHHDTRDLFSVVHNGIIENFQQIKSFLQDQGVAFASDTDSEVIPQLLAHNYAKTKDVEQAFISTVQTIRGAYGIAMISTLQPTTIYCAKLSSPLAIGVGKNEMFVGSDAVPISPYTNQVVFLEDNDIAVVTIDGYRIIDATTKQAISRDYQVVENDQRESGLGEFEDYMSKEMHEAPQTVRSALLGRLRAEEGIIKLGGLSEVQQQLGYIDRIIILACGTSLYAGMVGEYLLEQIAGIPVEIQQASEFRYRDEPLSRSTAVIVVSQSGETADVIAGLKKIEGSGMLKLGVVNAIGSTLSRLTDAGVYCHAGPEKAVASTKAFIAQVTVLTLIALSLSKNYADYDKLINELNQIPQKLEQVLASEKKIKKLAKKYSKARDFLYIGRRYAYPVALEGALKLKEISYVHAEGFAGGEMKHGPLALIDESFPTFAIALSGDVAEKTASNMQEIASRGGPIIAVVDDESSEAAKIATDTIVIPRTLELLQPLLSVTVTHLFAYHVAKHLGRDIDKPRNLAKSVTVE